MPTICKENQLNLALRSLSKDPSLSLRRAAEIYSVSRSTLSTRRHGTCARRDTIAKSRKLTDLEESTIVQRIFELDIQGFPSRLCGVEEMANRLLRDRDAPPVGKNWTSNFIARHPELKTAFSRKYDYQRALCEDSDTINAWFLLVRNFTAKYGIIKEDIYNFDETGFLMGQISTTKIVTSSERRGHVKLVQPGNREWVSAILGVNSQGWSIPPFLIVKGKTHLRSWYQNSPLPPDWVIAVSENGWTTNELGLQWVQHFDKSTKARTQGKYRLLVLDGHESHHSDDFEQYCKDNNILTLCMPPHSSHLLQPLDVGCFGPLKKAYGAEIEYLVRAHITHISKEDFFPAFKAAFDATITEANIKGGFRGAGLVPMDPRNVISKLDVKLVTPQSSRPSSREAQPWVSKTPQNSIEASSQSEYIKNQIARHQSSSPTSLFSAVDQFTKGTHGMMHKMVLLKEEVTRLREANQLLSRRRRARKTHVRRGGHLTVQDAQDQESQKDIEQQLEQEKCVNDGRAKRNGTRERRCGRCNQPGHNTRTCNIDVKSTSESESD